MLSIVRYRPHNVGGCLGYVDIQLEPTGLVVRNCAVLLDRKTGGIRVKMPEYREYDGKGEPRWVPAIEWVKGEKREAWQRAATALVTEHLDRHYPDRQDPQPGGRRR